MSTLSSLNSKTNYLVGDERVTANDCVPPLEKVDTYYLGYSHSPNTFVAKTQFYFLLFFQMLILISITIRIISRMILFFKISVIIS